MSFVASMTAAHTVAAACAMGREACVVNGGNAKPEATCGTERIARKQDPATGVGGHYRG